MKVTNVPPTSLYFSLLSHYEIQPEGPVQQITYVTEKDSALLRLIKEEDARRSAHDAHPFCMPVLHAQ